jgi:hypothetical protein
MFVSHAELLTAVQEHPFKAVTLTLPVLPLAEKDWPVGKIEEVQVKFAIAFFSPVIVSEQGLPCPAQSPPQLVKFHPLVGLAISFTTVPRV